MRDAPYKIQMRARSGDQSDLYSFRSAEGVRNPENVLPEEVLMLQGADVERTSAVLSVDSRIGVTGSVLGNKARAGRTMMTESNARASLLSELNRRRNQVSSAEVMLTSEIQRDCIRKYDVATYIPRKSDPESLVKQKILEASHTLREEGKLYLAGEKKFIENFEDFLERFGDIGTRVKNDSKLLEVEQPEKKRINRCIDEKKIEHSIKGETCRFRTVKGFFDAEDLNMVEMLSREIEAEKNDRVLDLESGCGAAGIFTSKLYGSEIVLVDRNTYQTRYARDNCQENEVEKFKAITEDGAENLELNSFDKVIYRVAEDRNEQLVEEDLHNCRRILKEDGELFICHRKDFPGEKKVRQFFEDVKARRREVDYQVTVGKR
ncbi:MAG: methyltransferase [Candidatus Nanosalina sp.]